MKKYFFMIAALLFISYGYNNAQTVGEVLTPEEFQQKLHASGTAVVVDVRTPEEYADGHLADAENVDFRSDDFRKNIEALDRSRPYYLYCRSGSRSASAAEIMVEMGFTEVYDLAGGITAWKAANMPVSAEE